MEHPVAFGRYHLLQRIAQGGMAEIYLAKLVGAAGVEKTLALKRIHNKHTEEARFLELFINEGRISASLSHSNIVAVYDFGRVGDEYYLAMEYVPGRDIGALLRTLREKNSFLPWGLVLYIGTQILTGLSYVHRRHKVTHGDITPRNLLLSQEGEVKLADFGVARVGQAFEGKLRGTIPYMSPEQAGKHSVDPRSDLFSVALVLAEMLQGAPLYQETNQDILLAQVRRAEFSEIKALDPNVPRDLITVLQKALSLNKEDRYNSADEMLAALDIFFALARETKSPCTPVGLSVFLQDNPEPHTREPGKLQGSNKPAQSFAETHTNLSDARSEVRTQTADQKEPPKVFSPETPLASQRIDIASGDILQPRKKHLLAVSAIVAGLIAFLLMIDRFVQPQPATAAQPLAPIQTTTSPSSLSTSEPSKTTPPTPSSAPATVPAQPPPATAPATAPTTQIAPKEEPKKKKPGYLSIDVHPWANIEIDGKAKGETPLFRIPLTPGKHTIKAHHPGLNKTKIDTVTIEEGAEVSKKFIFTP